METMAKSFGYILKGKPVNKVEIKMIFLAILLTTLVLAACGSDTPTTVSVTTTTAPASTAAATTAPITTAAVTTSAAPAPAGKKSLLNVRYCEVIPLFQESGKLVQYVYNTLGLNNCPAASWNALNADDLAKSLGAVKVELNGPRYWLLDQIIASGDTATGEVKTFGDLKMQLRAKVEVPVGSASAGSGVHYSPVTVLRNTEYVFGAGKPTFQLISAEGDEYIMQTYSQIIDPKLTINDLPNLAARLQLPKGWQYRVVTPDQDLHLVASGKAYVLQDDLENSYQKVIK